MKTWNNEEKPIYKPKKNKTKRDDKKAKRESLEEFGNKEEGEHRTNKGRFWRREERRMKRTEREQTWNMEDKNSKYNTEQEDILEVQSNCFEEKFTFEQDHNQEKNGEAGEDAELDIDSEISQEDIKKTVKMIDTGIAGGKRWGLCQK